MPSFALAQSSNPIDNLQPGHWYEVPNSKIRDVLPNPIPPGNPISIITAWNSGAYDTKRDRYIVWGGGHNDYGGNEIYAFDINTLKWSRVWGPSPNIPPTQSPTCPPTYSDGNPVSRHTYDVLEYLPNVDRFWLNGGSYYCGPGYGGPDTWVFDFTTLQWERKADFPDGGSLGMVSAYDPVTGHVFMAATNSWHELWEYDPVADRWTQRGDLPIMYGQVATIDPVKRQFVSVGAGAVYAYTLQPQGTLTRRTLNTTGDSAIVNTGFPGIDYDSQTGKLVAWNGGVDVYALDMDTLIWTKISPAPTNTVIPTQPTSNGTYNRWRYVPSKNVFIIVNSIDENVYVYKLSSGSGTPPPTDTTAPSTPTNLSATAVSSSSINLSWIASTDNVGVTGYRVERCAGSTCTNFSQIATPSGTSYSDTGLSANTTYRYRVRAVDAAGNLSSYSNIVSSTTQSAPPAGSGDGLSVTYYDNINFTGTTVTRVDPTINFDWGSGSPDPAIDSNTFSARWTGQILPQYSEVYTFYTRTDDGVRLWVGNQLLIDAWIDQSPTEWSGTIALQAGTKYDIKMEYYENAGGAVAELRWSSPSTPKQIIPQSQLFSVSSPIVPDTTPPSTPANLTATAVSSSQINLAWTASTDNVGVVGYKIYRNGTQVATTANTSYADTGLSANTSYTYAVAAYDAAGNTSAQSSSVISVMATTQSGSSCFPLLLEIPLKVTGMRFIFSKILLLLGLPCSI